MNRGGLGCDLSCLKIPSQLINVETARATGFLSQIGTKLRDWAIGQAGDSFYSRAALSSNDSKTLYRDGLKYASQVP